MKSHPHLADRTRNALLLAVGIAVLAVAPFRALADGQVPFRAAFNVTNVLIPLQFPPDLDPTQPIFAVRAGGPGVASLLGRASCITVDQVGYLSSLATATYTFTAANGDTLIWHGEAYVAPDPTNPFRISFEGTGEFIGGTGRFANATGETTFIGWSEVTNLATGQGIGYFRIDGMVSTPNSR